MTDYKKLNIFFKSLNSNITHNEFEKVIGDLFHKKVLLKIFGNIIDNPLPFAEYWEELSGQFKNYYNLLDGKNLVAKQKVIAPIFIQEQLLGTIELYDYTEEDFELLELIKPVLALKYDNIKLKEKIDKNIEFHDAMKNIVKIIETQYELNYIIPIIGEILDTFIEHHLIYIFLKQNGKEKLVWPASCFDKKIFTTVAKLIADNELTFKQHNKIGYFPLISENILTGYIVTKSMDGEISAQDIYYLQQLSAQAATTIARAKVYAEILKFATLDALTGFYNRRQLDERVKQEVSAAKRKNTELCAIMIDIDFFKKVNDTYGHAAGDVILKTVARVMRTQLREYDIAARYGGEEFVILLPSTDENEAVRVAERLRQAVASKIIDIEKVNTKNNVKHISVSISLGVCCYKKNFKEAELIMNADKALYTAKETGRNKVVLWE